MLSARERLKRWLPYEHSRGWLGEAASVVIPKLEAEALNELAEAGGHGVDLSKMTAEEIRERLFGDAPGGGSNAS